MIMRMEQLPEGLRRTIGARTFLFARHLKDEGRYIARYLSPDGVSKEIEYDEALGRALTDEERAIPTDKQWRLRDEGLNVSSRYFIDPQTAELCACHRVTDDAGREVLQIEKAVYPAMNWTAEELIKDELKRRRFPEEYAKWPREDKVAWWAAKLHRFRRVRGESGRDEDEIYTADLVADMEKIDPRVRELLPEVLTEVGRLEQTAPEEALDAFVAKTGIPVDNK